MTIDEWVRKVNSLAAEIDDIAASLHPLVWNEQLADLHERYQKLCGKETDDDRNNG